MHPVFLNYLLEGGWLTPEQAASPRTTVSPTISWMGQLMVDHGLITLENVNQILNRQDVQGGFFGENAMSIGLITRAQLDTLLAAQELRRNIETIEELALAGVLPFEHGLAALVDFYSKRTPNPRKRRSPTPARVGQTVPT